MHSINLPAIKIFFQLFALCSNTKLFEVLQSALDIPLCKRWRQNSFIPSKANQARKAFSYCIFESCILRLCGGVLEGSQGTHLNLPSYILLCIKKWKIADVRWEGIEKERNNTAIFYCCLSAAEQLPNSEWENIFRATAPHPDQKGKRDGEF